MTTPVTSQDRSAFYGAAVLGLRALDARERTARRFDADAEARWTQFAGALGAGDRLDVLLRDAAGTWGAAFSPLLIELVPQATNHVVDDLLQQRDQTLVLAWPGALARHSLAGALSRVVEGVKRGDAPAILRMLPSHTDGNTPSINGRLPVPAPLPSQRLVMPDAWPANAHKAAE